MQTGTVMLLFAGVCLIMLIGLLAFSWCVRPIKQRDEAQETYECGYPAKGDPRAVGFGYLGYATLFLIFDIAAVYLFLFATIPHPSSSVTTSMLLALGTLALLIIAGTKKRRYYVA